jgi:hypothetical protein
MHTHPYNSPNTTPSKGWAFAPPSVHAQCVGVVTATTKNRKATDKQTRRVRAHLHSQRQQAAPAKVTRPGGAAKATQARARWGMCTQHVPALKAASLRACTQTRRTQRGRHETPPNTCAQPSTCSGGQQPATNSTSQCCSRAHPARHTLCDQTAPSPTRHTGTNSWHHVAASSRCRGHRVGAPGAAGHTGERPRSSPCQPWVHSVEPQHTFSLLQLTAGRGVPPPAARRKGRSAGCLHQPTVRRRHTRRQVGGGDVAGARTHVTNTQKEQPTAAAPAGVKCQT